MHHGGSCAEAKAGMWDFSAKCTGYPGEREPAGPAGMR